MIASFGDVVFLGRGFYREEVAGYHFPMKKVVRDVTFSGVFPHWNPAFHAGQPLAANPAHELFYPPQWFIYLPSFRWGFQIHIVFHIVVAAVGMYAFLRSLQLRAIAAAFGSIAFSLGGPFLSLIVRLPFFFSLTWMPLVLLFARRLLIRPNLRDFAFTALLLGLQVLIAEPTTLFQTGLLIGAYALYRLWRDRNPRQFALGIALVAGAVVCAALVAAVQLVPALDHARDSVRGEPFEWRVASNWSTPPVRLIEFFFPRVFQELAGADGTPRIRTLYEFRIQPFIWNIYVGVLTALLALTGFLARIRGRVFVLLLLALLLVLAFGSRTPLFRLLYESGLFASVRYPEKFLLGASFVVIVWATVVLDRLLAGEAAVRRTLLVLIVIWTAVAVVRLFGDASTYWGWNLVRGVIVAVLIAMLGRRKPWLSPAAIAFLILDLSFLHFETAARTSGGYFDEPEIARSLPQNRPDYRIFHQAAWDIWEGTDPPPQKEEAPEMFARNAMLPFFGTAFGFYGALEDDLDQTALMNTTQLLRSARQVTRLTRQWPQFFFSAANVTHVGEFAPDGTVAFRERALDGPRYYFAERLIRVGNDELIGIVADGAARPRDAFVSFPPFDSASGDATRLEEKPGLIRLKVRAGGQALLVASHSYHKYWRAFINGRSAEVHPVNIAFLGVVVPPGSHVVEFRYRNPLVLPFGIVSLAAVAGLGVFAWRGKIARS